MKIKNLLFIIFCGVLFGLAGIQSASAATNIICYSNCSNTYTNVVGVYTLSLQCNTASPTSYTARLTVNGISTAVNKYCPPPPPTLSASVSPSSIAYNSSATISWSSANTNSCYGYSFGSAGATWNNGRWNAIATSGSVSTGALSSISYFYIYCAGKNGNNVLSSSWPMIVTVAPPPPPPPTLSASVSPSSIAYNSSATISWSSANTNSCYGYSFGSAGATWNNGRWNAIATSGSVSTGALSSISYFYIYCAGKNGNNVFSSPYPMTVTVAAPPYNYTFNSNGGTPSYATKTQTAGTSVTSPGSPTRTGYTFTGWSPALPRTMPSYNSWSTAQWTLNSYTVSTSAGAGGTISPASRSVSYGSTTTFTVNPNAGYTASASGCGGSLSGTTYTTGAITGACTVSASYSINFYTVSISAGAGGTISPASRSVSYGSTTTFTVNPNAGYVASVTGCAGSLSGTTYTTGAVMGACTVSAAFIATNTSTSPTISINPTTYYVGVSNTYTFIATDLQSDRVRYGIDWNMDGAADEWLPVFPGYVNSGTSRSTSYTWPTTGNKQFQALTQDYPGLNSTWTVRNITVTDVPCANNAINPTTCTQCTNNIAYTTTGYCVDCSTGGCTGTGGNSTNSNSTLTCNSGAINIPNCTVCPGGQTLIGSMCVNNCTNGATNPTTCNVCPVGQELVGGTCTVTTFCGDSTCNGSETILTCPADCKGVYQQF